MTRVQDHEEKILIVEDDVDLRETLATLLQLRGYDVVAASNGREALERLDGEAPPCLILLDLMMPVMDGWAFRRALLAEERLSGVPVVVVSGAEDVEREASELAVAAFLVKPVQFEDVYRLVQTHC